MAWAKVDDQWYAHRKVVPVSMAARGLWTTVLSWSCAQRSDHVPDHMVRFLAGGEQLDDEIKELVTAGLWVEVEDGWVIHDWAEYQERSLSEKRAEAGRKGGKASGEARREATDEANAKQTKQPDEANSEAGTHPGPALPDPTQPPPPSSGGAGGTSSRKRSDRATRLPDDWRPTPEPELVAAIGGQTAAQREFERFGDYWRAQGGQKGRKTDWQATWRNWLRKAADDRDRRDGSQTVAGAVL